MTGAAAHDRSLYHTEPLLLQDPYIITTDLMILRVFSNLNDSIQSRQNTHLQEI